MEGGTRGLGVGRKEGGREESEDEGGGGGGGGGGDGSFFSFIVGALPRGVRDGMWG